MSTLRYSVDSFGPDIVAAYDRLFPESRAGKAVLLSWRFERGPHGPGRFAVARDEGRIIGMIALVATRLRVGSAVRLGYQAIDTVVDPAYRGRGVFVGLGQAAQDSANHDGRVLWGFPNANAAPGWFGRLGWETFGTVPFLVRPLRTGYVFRKLIPWLAGVNLPLIGKPAAPARIIDRFSADAGALWMHSRGPDSIAVDRDADWLNWRLIDRPGAPYRSVGSFNTKGALEAFVSTCLLDKHGGRICYVMEAMGADDRGAPLPRLLHGELARATEEGAEVALAWCPRSAPVRAAYRRAGFLPLPDRLRPAQIHFGARALVPQAEEAIADGSKWFISYLDSDTV